MECPGKYAYFILGVCCCNLRFQAFRADRVRIFFKQKQRFQLIIDTIKRNGQTDGDQNQGQADGVSHGVQQEQGARG